MRDMLAGGKFVLLNTIAEGGPFTWLDPANQGNKSCLDLAWPYVQWTCYHLLMKTGEQITAGTEDVYDDAKNLL